MANRIFISAVVVFWLSSMTWLVSERILPSFSESQPPVVQAYEEGEAVAWEVLWENKVVGKAASVRVNGVGGATDLYNRLVLDEFPVMQLAPVWLRAALGELDGMTFDTKTRLEFDPLGNFSSFHSRISLNDLPSIITMTGRIEESFLNLKVSSNDMSHTAKIFLPNNEALSELLFPTAKMPGLQIGQAWQEKVYSPFSSPTNPVEVVQVNVGEIESLEYHRVVRRVMRVEYRSLSGSGLAEHAKTQGVSWVDPLTGDVLRHEVYFGNSKLRFERMPVEEAKAAGRKLFEDQLLETGYERDATAIQGPKDVSPPAGDSPDGDLEVTHNGK